jgi:hypothetical protein
MRKKRCGIVANALSAVKTTLLGGCGRRVRNDEKSMEFSL